MRQCIICAMLLWAIGCASQNKQLSTCQAEKEQLLGTIRAQRETERSLTEQVASLESRLDQAEKQLARTDGTTRLSSLGAAPSTKAAKADPLPWRAPAAKDEAGRAPASLQPPAPGKRAATSKAKLLELAQREPAIHYDAKTLSARIDLPLEFHEQRGALSSGDKSRLDEVSRLLRGPAARDLPIIIAGPMDQAQAVANYLDRHGIADQRLSVVDQTGSTSMASPGVPPPANVSIHLASDESPLVTAARQLSSSPIGTKSR